MTFTGGYRTKGAKDKQPRCKRGTRRSSDTGECKPSYYFIKDADNNNDTLFHMGLIRELSRVPEIKNVLKTKNIRFETLSRFKDRKTKLSKSEIIERIGSICGDTVSADYREESLEEAIYDSDPYTDILFIKNKKQNILGFVIAELGGCTLRPQTYAIKLICSESGLGKLLLGACIFCIKNNEDVYKKSCVLELAHGYTNMPGFFMYTKLGFNVDNSLIGDDNTGFYDPMQMPMSLNVTDKYTKQYIADMIVRSNFKQTDVVDPTNIYDLGLPKSKQGTAVQEDVVLIANLLRKYSLSLYEDFPINSKMISSYEWEYITDMKFFKRNKLKFTSQYEFRTHLYDFKSQFFKELEDTFNKKKQEYKRIQSRN